MDKVTKINLISCIILVGFTLGVVVHYCLGSYLHLPFPFNTFLFHPGIHFSDFTGMMPVAKEFSPFTVVDYWRNYFPLAYILMFPFSLINNSLISYFIFASGFLAFITYMNMKNFICETLKKIQNFQNIFIITFLAYPVLYIVDRGNFDMFLFILFVGFVYFFKSEKYLLSAVFLAIGNAIKPFTIFFLVLFLFKKRYKEFFLSLVVTGLLVVGGFMLLKGNFYDQIVVFIKNLMAFKAVYVYNTDNSNAMTNTSSLFTALKLLLCRYTTIMSTVELAKLYNYLSIFITAATLFFIWREKTFWKQVSLLTFLMLLVPYVVGDYKLIFLFVPIWLFVNANEKTKFDWAYAALLGLLMIPKQFVLLLVHVGTISKLTTFGIVVNPLIMLIFIGLIIYEQFSNKTKEQKG